MPSLFHRPAGLNPFKIQESVATTKAKYLKCLPLVLVNQVVLFLMLNVLWNFYEWTAPDAFAEELPGLGTFVFHVLCYIMLAEILFYFPHRLLHKNKWLYAHVHSIHHSITSPFAMTAIYSHPAEFCVGNLPVVGAGPLLLGSHITVFWFWGYARSKPPP